MMSLKIHFPLACFLSFVFAFTASAQHRLSLQAGASRYSTAPAISELDLSENDQIFSHATSEVSKPFVSPVFGLEYQYRYSDRFRFGAGLSFLRTNTVMNKGAFIQRTLTPFPDTTVDLSSTRTLRVTRFDGMAWLNLFPSRKSTLLIGTGISLIFREHDYRSYLHLDFNSQNQPNTAGYSYNFDSENSVGIPLAAQLNLPLTAHWHLLATGTAGFYRNRDHSFTLTGGLAYSW